jgi:hypothetical protein
MRPSYAGAEKLLIDYTVNPVEVFDGLTGYLSRSSQLTVQLQSWDRVIKLV